MTKRSDQTSPRHVFRLPVAVVAVFMTGALVAGAVTLVLYFGLGSATTNTRLLWVEQAELLIDAMKGSIETELVPAQNQAQWIVDAIEHRVVDIDDPQSLDTFVFGAMGGVAQVTHIGFVKPNGQGRVWQRDRQLAMDVDWSHDPEIMNWLESRRFDRDARWQEPIWTPAAATTGLLHDQPVWRDGQFLGMIGQLVPISDFSKSLSREYAQTGMTPFVLYDRRYVLAHPLLIDWLARGDRSDSALLDLEMLGDPVLRRIFDPDETDLFFLRGLRSSQSAYSDVGGKPYVYIYSELHDYGAKPWMVGIHIDTQVQNDPITRNLNFALGAGLAVLAVATLLALWVGTRLHRPIRAIADASQLVERGELTAVTPLKQSWIRELDDAARSFNVMVGGLREREVIRETLGRYVPEEVASRLLLEGGELPARESDATILMCDIEGFTSMTESLGPTRTIEVLNAFFSKMVDLLADHDGVVTQFQGDAILATFNVPIENVDHCTNAVLAALQMTDACHTDTFAGHQLNIRVGINTGLVVAGAVGATGRLSYTVHGDAVNLAARVESINKLHNTRILVTENTVKHITALAFRLVGETQIRGQTQPVRLYEPKQ